VVVEPASLVVEELSLALVEPVLLALVAVSWPLGSQANKQQHQSRRSAPRLRVGVVLARSIGLNLMCAVGERATQAPASARG
jgi:hypothetical protein